MQNEPFHAPEAMCTVTYLRHRTEKIVRLMDELELNTKLAEEISSWEEGILFCILNEAEKMCCSIRTILQNSSKPDESDTDWNDQDNGDYFPVKVECDGASLTVHTPLTYSRKMKESYFFTAYIQAALKEYEQKSGSRLFRMIAPPFSITVTRRISAGYKLKDLDNNENGRIINAIYEALGYSDCPELTPLFISKVEHCGRGEEECVIKIMEIKQCG